MLRCSPPSNLLLVCAAHFAPPKRATSRRGPAVYDFPPKSDRVKAPFTLSLSASATAGRPLSVRQARSRRVCRRRPAFIDPCGYGGRSELFRTSEKTISFMLQRCGVAIRRRRQHLYQWRRRPAASHPGRRKGDLKRLCTRRLGLTQAGHGSAAATLARWHARSAAVRRRRQHSSQCRRPPLANCLEETTNVRFHLAAAAAILSECTPFLSLALKTLGKPSCRFDFWCPKDALYLRNSSLATCSSLSGSRCLLTFLGVSFGDALTKPVKSLWHYSMEQDGRNARLVPSKCSYILAQI